MKKISVAVSFFAHVRERVGRKAVEVELSEGATVRDLWGELISRYPVLRGEGRIRVAVNREYSEDHHMLADGDEVAVIPPVSGGTDRYVITDGAIDLGDVISAVGDPGAGATVIFQGTTRNENGGKRVEELEYEAYTGMAEAKMRRIGDEIRKRWDVVSIAMVHRVGRVGVAEASVAIAVSAAHRREAFEACRYGIDVLKTAVPIWKKEHYGDGSRWLGQS